MTRQLFVQAILKFLFGAVLLGVLIFLPTGMLYYWNAWLLTGILFVYAEYKKKVKYRVIPFLW